MPYASIWIRDHGLYMTPDKDKNFATMLPAYDQEEVTPTVTQD